ncbi:hypothetical protein EG329_003709 [Mollisiaceae sp. DMI_Dod_QoI]|nr:hypothetical protein EG329_003709 [Helotiales sp. DMI_Dod_QoI]
MSPSSAPSSSSDSSSSQSDTLLQNEIIIKEHPKDTLPHSADSPSSLLLHEDTRTTMPPRNRSKGRDVHIFNASDRDTSIGGLILTAGVTNANLYTMIEIVVIFNGEYILRNESDTTIDKNDSLLLPGNYYIDSPHAIHINNETPLTRTISLQTGTRVQAFTDADNYKIIYFIPDENGIAGKHFDQRPLDDPQRPADELLRWHFRQAVLTNIKGAGEPVFEHDFPPGSDIVSDILKGPKAVKRMEFELFSRLATQFDLTE